MKLYIDIILTFFKIGLVSFGGGYAMIPVIQNQVEAHSWLDTSRFTDVITVSAMAPGPVAANSATIVGFRMTGLLGAVIACIGVTLPSVLLIVLFGGLFVKYQENKYVKAAFYGLRSVIVGLIAYTAIRFALTNRIIGGAGFVDVRSLIFIGAAAVLMLKRKLHPVVIMLVSAAAGILVF